MHTYPQREKHSHPKPLKTVTLRLNVADVMSEALTLRFCKTTVPPLLLCLIHSAVAENSGEMLLSLSSRLLDCQSYGGEENCLQCQFMVHIFNQKPHRKQMNAIVRLTSALDGDASLLGC